MATFEKTRKTWSKKQFISRMSQQDEWSLGIFPSLDFPIFSPCLWILNPLTSWWMIHQHKHTHRAKQGRCLLSWLLFNHYFAWDRTELRGHGGIANEVHLLQVPWQVQFWMVLHLPWTAGGFFALMGRPCEETGFTQKDSDPVILLRELCSVVLPRVPFW